MLYRRIFLFIFLIVVCGCASSVKQIKDSNIPFQRPYYSILPPQGENWLYVDQEQAGSFNLTFGKKFSSSTHSLVGLITENHVYATFDNPEEFLKYINKGFELNTDPRRFISVNKETVLDDKFGDYSIRYYSVTEDHNAANKGGNEFLVFNIYGYTFIHPQFNNIIMDIQYSERGLPEEIDPNFKETAAKFINGLILKAINNK